MRPKRWFLPRQEQIRLPHRLSRHDLPRASLLVIVVDNPPVGNGVHDVHASRTHFTRESLRQLTDACAAWWGEKRVVLVNCN